MWLPDCSGDVKNYEIYRNGRKIGETVDSYVCSFRDKTAAYPEYYTYKVASVTFDGEKVFSNELPVRHNDLRFSHSEHSSVKNAKRNPFRIFYKPNK